MAANVRKFAWDKDRLQAAQLIAEGNSTEQVAERLGTISVRQVYRWKNHPEFTAKVEQIILAIEAEVLKVGIARRAARVRALNDRWEREKSIIAERAASDEMQEVPGGKSGMLVKDVKQIGSGESAFQVNIYSFDAALAASLLAHEKQAAQELGQWVEKVAPTDPSGEESYEPGSVSPEDAESIVLAIITKLGH